MANKIKLKRSSFASLAPNSSQVDVGELAINARDEILYTKNSSGAVVEIAGKNYAKKSDLYPLTVSAERNTLITSNGNNGYQNSNIVKAYVPIQRIEAGKDFLFKFDVISSTHPCQLEFEFSFFADDPAETHLFKCNCLTGYKLYDGIRTYINKMTSNNFYADFRKSNDIFEVCVINRLAIGGFFMGWYQKILAA